MQVIGKIHLPVIPIEVGFLIVEKTRGNKNTTVMFKHGDIPNGGWTAATIIPENAECLIFGAELVIKIAQTCWHDWSSSQ